MVQIIQILVGVLLVAGFSWRLAFSYQRQKERSRLQAQSLAELVRMAMPDAMDQMSTTVGVTTYRGMIDGQHCQVQLIVDTLATRKLPSWWLSVTVSEPVHIDGTFDLVMRPNSVLSFSNFDLRPNSLKVPAGFPEQAAMRSDVEAEDLPLDVIASHVQIMGDPRAKEMLISPQGVRLVWLLAEADRARYGVFRQADFGDALPSPKLILTLADRAMALRSAINSQDLLRENPKMTTKAP